MRVRIYSVRMSRPPRSNVYDASDPGRCVLTPQSFDRLVRCDRHGFWATVVPVRVGRVGPDVSVRSVSSGFVRTNVVHPPKE